ADAVEAFCDIGVQDELGLVADLVENGLDGIVTGPSRSEAAGVGLEARFPLRLQGQLDQGLGCSVGHRGDAQGSFFLGAGLGDPYPADRPASPFQVQVLNQQAALVGVEAGDAIDPRRLLALVVLSDPAYGQQLGRRGPQQQTLQVSNSPPLPLLLGPIDATLERVDLRLDLVPASVLPRRNQRRETHRRSLPRCLRSARTDRPYPAVSRAHVSVLLIPRLSPGPSLLGPSSPRAPCA